MILKSAYHQIPISQAERTYTAFEAGVPVLSHTIWSGQWCRIFSATCGQSYQGGAAERHIPLPR